MTFSHTPLANRIGLTHSDSDGCGDRYDRLDVENALQVYQALVNDLAAVINELGSPHMLARMQEIRVLAAELGVDF